MTENKFIFYTYTLAFGIPSPKIYAIYDPHLSSINGFTIIKTIDQLIDFISQSDITQFVIKPVEGTRGQSVLILLFDKERTEFRFSSGEPLTTDYIANVLQGYNYRGTSQSSFLVQERLTPHESTLELSEYVPFSYRALTLLDESDNPHIISIYGKSATGKNVTDNRHAEGLVCLLDDTGLCYGARRSDLGEIFDRHPTDGFMLKGWRPPFYNQVCELALRLAKTFFLVRCVAWDITVAKNGVYVIEGNNPWNKAIQRVYDKGLYSGAFGEEARKAIENGPSNSPWW